MRLESLVRSQGPLRGSWRRRFSRRRCRLSAVSMMRLGLATTSRRSTPSPTHMGFVRSSASVSSDAESATNPRALSAKTSAQRKRSTNFAMIPAGRSASRRVAVACDGLPAIVWRMSLRRTLTFARVSRIGSAVVSCEGSRTTERRRAGRISTSSACFAATRLTGSTRAPSVRDTTQSTRSDPRSAQTRAASPIRTELPSKRGGGFRGDVCRAWGSNPRERWHA